jgi:hypothetical protein
MTKKGLEMTKGTIKEEISRCARNDKKGARNDTFPSVIPSLPLPPLSFRACRRQARNLLCL